MFSNDEFLTMSSDEVSSLPSSHETTAEGKSNLVDSYIPLRDFLERFSLPRVVRLEDSAGRPVLLYKQQQCSLRVTAHLLMHRYRHDVKIGPEIVIPEGYPGWFSIISGNGTTNCAIVYRRMETLVHAGVPAFLLAAPFRAYILTHSKMENGNLRAHYTKALIRAGEVLRLVAIFQDARRGTISFNIVGNLSDRDQYAQCLDSHGREIFAPLSARGEFYAVCQNDDSSSNISTNSDTLLYKVQHLAKRQLPLRVRLIAGPLPIPLPREYGGLMQLESSTRGPIVLGCLIPEIPIYDPEMLELLVTGNSAPRVRRARLGFSSEARLLTSHKMQQLLTSCGRAVGNRATEPRVSPQNLYREESIKEIHLKKVKSKSVAKPILQSLRESLEYLKKPATTSNRTEAQTINVNINQNFNTGVGGSSIFECISKLRQISRCRNPAKKSASFTFSIRPEISMKFNQKYSNLEATEFNSYSCGSVKQSVQRSVSTSALAMPTTNFADSPSSSSACVIQLQPDYSRVRDSLAPPIPKSQLATITSSTQLITTKPDDIYTEICENQLPVLLHPSGHIMARIKILVEDDQHCDRSYQQDYDRLEHRKIDRKYVNSIFVGRKQN